MGEQASLPPLTTPKFVTFPVAHDPNFGDTDTHDVDSDPLWKEAAVSVVNDPEDTRQKRLEELRDELKRRSIKLCPGDKNQLLAMLRAGQGQVARALHVIEVFLQYQQYEKNGLPSHVEPMLRNTLKDFVVLPHRDKYGRRIVVFKMWDAEKWSYRDGMKAFYIIMLLLSREPKTQLAGVTMIGDYSGMSRKHMATNLDDIKAWANLISGGVPIWFHRSHICNAPWLFEILFNMVKPFISETARNGVMLHKRGTGWNVLHEAVGSADILPEEFGGNAGPMNNMNYLNALLNSHQYFAELRKCTKDDQI